MKFNSRTRLFVLLLGSVSVFSSIAIAYIRRIPAIEPESPWYVGENIQFIPPGPEFKLAREAAAMKAYKADLESQQTEE